MGQGYADPPTGSLQDSVADPSITRYKDKHKSPDLHSVFWASPNRT